MRSGKLAVFGLLNLTLAFAIQSCGSHDSKRNDAVSNPPAAAPDAGASLNSPLPVPATGVVTDVPVASDGGVVTTPTPETPTPVAIEPEPIPAEPTPVVVDPTPIPDPIPLPQPTVPVPQPLPAHQIARFTVWLDQLDKYILGYTPEEAAVKLEASNAREITFNLQGLGRIYKDQDPRFKKIRDTFKALEDGIGNYQKYKDLVNDAKNANVGAVVMDRLVAQRDANFLAFQKMLVSSNFIPQDGITLPYTQSLRNFLNSYAWLDFQADRDAILKNIIKEIEEVKTSKYDFSHLEAGDGVHEFRKKMRWISMEARGLNGMITLKDRSTPCPIEQYSNIVFDSIANTKYAVLPGSSTEPNPVSLTPCLYVQNAKLVDIVNGVKAKAELDDNLDEVAGSDAVDPKDQLFLENLLQEILDNNLFGLMQDELRVGLSTSIPTVPLPVPPAVTEPVAAPIPVP